jgi:hypothetical protein
VQDCRLPGVVAAAEERDAGMELERLVLELLEPMKGDPPDHGPRIETAPAGARGLFDLKRPTPIKRSSFRRV